MGPLCTNGHYRYRLVAFSRMMVGTPLVCMGTQFEGGWGETENGLKPPLYI